MKIQYGSFTTDENECWFDIQKEAKHSEIGFSEHVRTRWIIWGVRKAASQSALTSAMGDLETAFSSDYKDLTFLDDSGNATHHSVKSADAINGTLVKRFRWLPGNPGIWGSGTEYTTRRTWMAVVEADVLDSQANILQWYETLRLIGNGGPRFAMIGSLTGPVQRQELQQFTPYRVIQRGYAFGHLAYPNPPAPIWPFALHGDANVEDIATPQFGAVRNTRFGIRWRYNFESATALTGGPTLI